MSGEAPKARRSGRQNACHFFAYTALLAPLFPFLSGLPWLRPATICCGALFAVLLNIGVLALDNDFDGLFAAEDVADDGLLALEALVDALQAYAFA